MCRSRAILSCLPHQWEIHPCFQAAQDTSLLWATHLGFACGQQINRYIIWAQRLVTMWIGSLSISQGLGLSFPFKKAQNHQSACKQAGQEKAKGQ